MPTGDKVVNVFIKKLLSKTDIKERLVQFVQDKADEIVAALFSGRSGVLDKDQITISNGSSGVGYLKADTSVASKLVTGDGHIITLPAPTIGLTDDIPFENAAAPYYVAVRYAQPVQELVEINERTGKPEYPALEESFGELGAPGSVTDVAGVKIQINVDNLLENGVDHSGRPVRVYLATPVSGVAATAFFNGVVTYAAPNNLVEITYSGANGPLGQDTSVNPPSTTPADYVVHVEGLSWAKNSDLRLNPLYAFLALVTGPTPTFDHLDQLSIFINDLDFAYDGLSGAGSGSRINADSGAVHIRSADSGDGRNAPNNPTGYRTTQLIDRSASTEAESVALTTVADEDDGANALHLVPLIAAGGYLQRLEPCTTVISIGEFSLDRGGSLDAVEAGVQDYDLVLLTGFSGAAVQLNGLYVADTVTQLAFRTVEIGTGAPVPIGDWPGAGSSGFATFLRARVKVGNHDWALTTTTERYAALNVLQGGNVDNADPVQSIFPNANEVGQAHFNNDASPTKKLWTDARAKLLGTTPGAMEASQLAGSQSHNTQLQLDRKANSDWMQFMFSAIQGDVSSIPYSSLQVLRGAGLSFTIDITQTGTQGVTITTGGVALLTAGLEFVQRAKLGLFLLLTTGTDKGLYVIKSTPITATTFEIMPLGSSAAPSVWSLESGLSGHILCPRFIYADNNVHQSAVETDRLSGLVHVCKTGQDIVLPLRIFPMDSTPGAADRALEVYREDSVDDNGLAVRVSADGVVQIGGASSNPGTIPAVQAGLTIMPRARGTGNADKYALNIKPSPIISAENMLPSHRAIGYFNDQGAELERWTQNGRRASCTRFVDNFHYADQGFLTTGNLAELWDIAQIIGAPTVRNNPSTRSQKHGGLIELETGALINAQMQLRGAEMFTPRDNSDFYRILNLAGSFRIMDLLTQMQFFIGIGGGPFDARGFGVRYVVGGTAGNITAFAADGSTTTTNLGIAAALGVASDPRSNVVNFHLRFNLQGNALTSWLSGNSSIDAQNIPTNTSTGWRANLGPLITLKTTDALNKRVQIFSFEAWDEIIDNNEGPKE